MSVDTNEFDVRSRCRTMTLITIPDYNTALPTNSILTTATLINPGAKTKMTQIITSEPLFCFMTTFELYFKDAGATVFKKHSKLLKL